MPVDAAGAMAIRLVGVAKRFGKRGQIEGLRGVDLEIRKGEFVAIMGPSGSGKSTLLSILGLLDSPTEGTVELLGIDTAKLSESQKDVLRGERLGFVFQNSYLVNDESASSNATLGLRIRGVPAKARRQRAVAALEAMGLSALADAKARTMSGGERNGWRWRGRWSQVPNSCWRTSQPALWIRNHPGVSSVCFARPANEAQRLWW